MCVSVLRGRRLLGYIAIRTEVEQPIDALVRVQRIRIVIVVRRIDGHKGDAVAEVVLRAKVVQERFEALERCVAAVAVGIAVGNAGRQAVAVMAERLMGISVGASASDAAIAAVNAINAAAAVVAVRDGSELHLKRAYRRRLGCCCRSRRC